MAHQLFMYHPLVPHICVSEWVSIGSDNDLSPIQRQAIVETNTGLLSIEPLGTLAMYLHFCPNLGVASIGADLSRGQAQTWVNLTFKLL